MVEKSKPWWRDPKFVIPSILIPVLAIATPLLFTEKVSTTLAVDIEIVDPRRPDPFLNIAFKRTFPIKKGAFTDKEIANELAKVIETKIDSLVPANPENRQGFEVLVHQGTDGSLLIEKSFSGNASLHLTRFPETKTAWDYIMAEKPYMVVQMTLEERDLFVPQPQKEVATSKLHLESGLYRVVATAPGYKDGYRLVELSNEGKLLMSNDFGDTTPVEFPFPISLFPRLGDSGRMTIGIQPFSDCTKLGTHKPLIEGIGRTIQRSLERELQRKKFSVFVAKPDINLGFHPYRLKKLGAPPDHKFADFLINGSCAWG